jgi:prolycopene isomerase
MVKQGAELLLSSRAVKILADQRRVQGVELEDGQKIAAPVVISNAEVPATFRGLLGPQQVSAAYLRRLERMELCTSGASLCLATNLDLRALGWPHESVIATDWNSDRVWEQTQSGQIGTFTLTVPTIGDPSLAPAGQHLVSMTSFGPDNARLPLSGAETDQRSRLMLAELEKVIPSISGHLSLKGNGASTQGYWLQTFGPMFGWAPTPQQSGLRRLGQTTPIAGLYLVGQWTQPGHGVMVVVLSGEAVARQVLAK